MKTTAPIFGVTIVRLVLLVATFTGLALSQTGSTSGHGLVSTTCKEKTCTVRNARTGQVLAQYIAHPHGEAPKADGGYLFQAISAPAGATNAFAWGVSRQQFTGGYSDSPTNADEHGLLFNSDGLQILDYPGAIITELRAINAEGTVVGAYTPDQGDLDLNYGMIYRNGTFTSVSGPKSTFTVLSGISDAGEIVGVYVPPPPQYEFVGILLANGTTTVIGYPGATYTDPADINESGEIVGDYAIQGVGSFSFSYLGGTFTTIEVPGANATDAASISNNGLIAGTYYDSENDLHGFVLKNGEFTTVDFPGATFTQIFGIENSGRIVGQYYGTNCPLLGQDCAFVATPQ